MGQTASQHPQDLFEPTEGEIYFRDVSATGGPSSQKRRFKHPWAATFHIIFKTLALLFYLFGGLFGKDFISTFVTVILLISMDFWVVKNVTGRLLAGLRWTNYIDDEGNSHWLFENKNKAQNSKDRATSYQESNKDPSYGSADSSIFWAGLIAAPVTWSLLMMVSIFKLNIQWLMLVALATVLSGSNLYGYTRCRMGTSDVRSSITQYVAKQVLYNFITGNSNSAKPTA